MIKSKTNIIAKGFSIKQFSIIFFLLCLGMGYSCKKDSKDTTSSIVIGYDYYPLSINSYVIYNVVDISIDAAVGKFDTLRYQLKELIADTLFSADTTVKRYKIERFTRHDTSQAWNILNVWQVIQSKNNLQRYENNVPLVKQVYPMSVGMT